MTSGQVIISRKLQSPDYNEKYKTELCRNWVNGFCSFDSKCVFAHGKEELRGKNAKDPYEETSTEPEPLKQAPNPKVYEKKRLPVFVALTTRTSDD